MQYSVSMYLLWALLIEVFARQDRFVITKPSMALSVVAFVKVVERISEDQDNLIFLFLVNVVN